MVPRVADGDSSVIAAPPLTEFTMSPSRFQRSAAFCLSALVTLAMLGRVAELFQRADTPAGMALSQPQNHAQNHHA